MRGGFAFLLGFVAGMVGVGRWFEKQFDGDRDQDRQATDEELAAAIRSEWRRLGLLAQQVDVTVIDGVTYLRGKADPVTSDTLLATARRLPGVAAIRDEVKRPA